MREESENGFSGNGGDLAGLEIREMTSADRPRVLELVKLVWGEELTKSKMAQWHWLYEKNPNNPPEGPRAKIVRDGDKVVGLFRCIPVPLKIGNTYFTNDWNVDLMIHPEYRGKGLAVGLAKALLAEGDVNTGLPLTNSPTYMILKKLNGRFVDVAPYPQIIRPFRMHAYARAVLKLPILSHAFAGLLWLYFLLVVERRKTAVDDTLLVQRIDAFDSTFDEFWEKVQRDYPIIVKADAKYLQWKFFERPDLTYTVFKASRGRDLAGYIVLRSDERAGVKTGFIVDILTRRDDVAAIEALIGEALSWSRREQVHLVSTQKFFVPTYREVMRRRGFLTKPSRRVRRIILTVNNDRIPRDVLTHPENWFITRSYAHQEM